jgi:hypothetical protein
MLKFWYGRTPSWFVFLLSNFIVINAAGWYRQSRRKSERNAFTTCGRRQEGMRKRRRILDNLMIVSWTPQRVFSHLRWCVGR